jgi:hypothetical protein
MKFGTKLPDGFDAARRQNSGKDMLSAGSKTPLTTANSSKVLNDTKHEVTASERNEYYMQLSDSDDDDKPDIPYMAHVTQAPRPTGKTNRPSKTVMVQFKHERPVMRERPKSARQFHTIASDDPELKVHYRHSNYRRMPISEKVEEWLENRETSRVQKSLEYAKKLAEELMLKKSKKKAPKDKNGIIPAKRSLSAATKKDIPVDTSTSKKYENASDFMSQHFPNFDDYGAEGDYLRDPESAGPMRTAQFIECARIMAAFEEKQIPIDENVLRRALMIPQDHPEAVCLEDLRDPINDEGLMINPIAREYWRKFRMTEKGKKKKSRRSV